MKINYVGKEVASSAFFNTTGKYNFANKAHNWPNKSRVGAPCILTLGKPKTITA